MAEEEKKEAWLSYLALSTVIFAVCATLATFKGGSYSTQSIMSQSKASDEWAHYQAKAIKADLYTLQSEKIEMQIEDQNSQNLNKKLQDYKIKIKKYETEKTNIKNKAQELENARDQAQIHAKNFGYAIIFLQITILLSSVSGLLKKPYIWYIGIVSGSVGLVYFFNGFLLFF